MLAALWGFQIPELLVMVGFAVALVYIGIRASRRIRTQEVPQFQHGPRYRGY